MRERTSLFKHLPGYTLAAVILGLVFAAGLLVSGGRAFSQAQPFQVTWNLANPPTEGRVGLRLSVNNLELTNSGTQVWPKDGTDQLKLAYRWYGSDGNPLAAGSYDDLRSELPQDIPPGGRLLFPQFLVGVPNTAGDYTLHIDLVQGADGWLSTKGAEDLLVKITIRGKDTTPPTSRVQSLPLFSTSTTFTVTWASKDEDGGSGVSYSDVQYRVSTDQTWHDWLLDTTASAARFTGENGKLYLFRSRAVDQAGNAGSYPENEQSSTRVDSLPPAARVEGLPAQSPSVFLVRWSSYDNVAGAAVSLCDVQYREGANGAWTDWLLGTSAESALFRGEAGKSYSFRVRAIDYAGNQGDYPSVPQATTTVSAAFDSLVGQLPTGSLSSPVTATVPVATVASSPSTTVSGTITPAATISPTVTGAGYAAYFPFAVKAGDNGSGTSNLMVYNPGTSPLMVDIAFYDQSGKFITGTTGLSPDQEQIAGATSSTVRKVVGPGETANIPAALLAPPNFSGWVLAHSDQPFQAYGVRQPATGQAVQYAATGTGTRLYLPYLKKSDALGSTYLNIANPSQTTAEYTITYYDAASGNVLANEKRTLSRYGSARFSINSLNTEDAFPRFQASAIITSNVPLAVSAEGLLEDGSAYSYPAQTALAPVAPQIPVYRDVNGVTTTLLVQNTGQESLTVKMEYFNSNGEIIASQQATIAGYSRQTVWAGDVPDLKAGFSGKVRVSTATPNGNIVVLVLGAGPGMAGRPYL
ncbi:MAG: Ig-like domain repeat protein [Chloroflexi bacterium]|nr:Ig-like domain repeat protein [Chloroflexota bacterium]OJV96309.1 MAG: hypothetical protein BGO39_00935 [Chloroflexi bacterium 54-19]